MTVDLQLTYPDSDWIQHETEVTFTRLLFCFESSRRASTLIRSFRA